MTDMERAKGIGEKVEGLLNEITELLDVEWPGDFNDYLQHRRIIDSCNEIISFFK